MSFGSSPTGSTPSYAPSPALQSLSSRSKQCVCLAFSARFLLLLSRSCRAHTSARACLSLHRELCPVLRPITRAKGPMRLPGNRPVWRDHCPCSCHSDSRALRREQHLEEMGLQSSATLIQLAGTPFMRGPRQNEVMSTRARVANGGCKR